MEQNVNFTHGDFADQVQRRQEMENIFLEEQRRQLFSLSKPDFNTMPLIESRDPQGKIYKFAVSSTEGFVRLTEEIIQISAQTPIGSYVLSNRSKIQPGLVLPNGETVISVGELTLPPDFQPLD